MRVLWHPSINQILTASTSGAVNVLYSPLTSLKGATLSVSKAPARRHLDDYTHEAARPIMTPHALPLFADDRTGGRGGGKRKRERDRMSAKRGNKTMRPEMPMVGAGKGGRIGTSAMSHVHKGLSKGLNSLAEDVCPLSFPSLYLLYLSLTGISHERHCSSTRINRPSTRACGTRLSRSRFSR